MEKWRDSKFRGGETLRPRAELRLAVFDDVIPAAADVSADGDGLVASRVDDIRVTRRIDDRLRQQRLPPALRFDDDGLDGVAFLQNGTEPRVVVDFHMVLQEKPFQLVHERDGIEARLVAMLFAFLRVAALRPAGGNRPDAEAWTLLRLVIDGQLDKLLADAAGDLMALSVAERQVDDDVADGRQPAERAESLQQADFGARPRGGQRRRHARDAAADHDDIISSKDINVFCRFVNGVFHKCSFQMKPAGGRLRRRGESDGVFSFIITIYSAEGLITSRTS